MMEVKFTELLLLFIVSSAYSEVVTSNITRFRERRPIQIPTTKSPPFRILPTIPANSSIKVQQTTTEKSSQQPSTTTTEKSSPQPTTTEKSFVVPKVISINANDDEVFAAFPLPSNFRFLEKEKDDLEETFTYQVKKQKRPTNFPPDFNDELNFLKHRVRSDTYEEMRNVVNDLNHQMSQKIRNIATTFDSLSTGAISNISALNTTFHQLNSEFSNLTILSNETASSVKALQLSHELDRTSLNSKMENLTAQLEKLQIEKIEEMKEMHKVVESLSTLQMKMDNTSQELRVHEAHLRYGQQLMASMKTSIEKNDEQIIGLQTDGGPQWAEQTVGCGGVIIANSGIISYKFRQPYLDNERCVWIIRANRRSKVHLQLIEDGFQNRSNSDFLSVTEFAGEEPHPVTLITSTLLEHGNKEVHTFQGPVIFVTFYSDSSNPGTGFLLKFEGVGNRSDAATTTSIRYTNLHFSAHTGTFKHPKESLTYQPNELVAVAINPQNANLVKIRMKASDLEKDEYCEFDSINFYGSVSGSYALTKRYCQQSEEFKGEVIQSSDGIFLIIFRSDASTQFSGFQFTWEAE